VTSRARLRLVQPPEPATTGYVAISRAAALRMSSVAARVHAAQRAFCGGYTTPAGLALGIADARMAHAELALVLRELESGS
jgi:hypothetical protein